MISEDRLSFKNDLLNIIKYGLNLTNKSIEKEEIEIESIVKEEQELTVEESLTRAAKYGNLMGRKETLEMIAGIILMIYAAPKDHTPGPLDLPF